MKSRIILILILLLLAIAIFSLQAFFAYPIFHKSYVSIINKSVGLYTPDRVKDLTVDEYWMLYKIDDKTRRVPPEYLTQLKERYKDNPYKKLIDKNDYIKDIRFERREEGLESKTGPDYYVVSNLPSSITNWDKILLKALYCDITGYDNEDFRILSLLKNKGGYYDTHFLLGLLFLQNNNCYDKTMVLKEIQQTAILVTKAIEKDSAFSDLYAERITLLYWAGYGKSIKKRMGG